MRPRANSTRTISGQVAAGSFLLLVVMVVLRMVAHFVLDDPDSLDDAARWLLYQVNATVGAIVALVVLVTALGCRSVELARQARD